MSNWKDFITHLFTTGHKSLPKIKQDMITHLENLFSGKPQLCGDYHYLYIWGGGEKSHLAVWPQRETPNTQGQS